MRQQETRSRSLATQVILAIAVCVTLAPAAAGAQSPCQPRTDAPGRECFVSLAGRDTNPGTITQPFRTIAKGVSVVQAGDVLSLRQGVYVEPVRIAGKQGEATQPIVIRSYPGEQATIDGSVPEFRTLNNQDWVPAPGPGARSDEYVSRRTFTDSVRGAFLDRTPYTRLITYSRLEDFRATNATFDQITDPSDPRPGPVAWEQCEATDQDSACVVYPNKQGVEARYKPAKVRVQCAATDPDPDCAPASDGNRYKDVGYRRPWVYMGPGIWFDPDAPPPQPVHIRLAPTSNNIPGLTDYTGPVNPRQVRLAISPAINSEDMVTLRVQGSRYLRFERLAIRYGGDYTIYLSGGTGLVFDHVRVFASTYGVRTGSIDNTTFQHCEFDGGQPSWYFRIDGKAEYYFLEGNKMLLNVLGKQTMRNLFQPIHTDTRTTIHHCEFHDAHDLYLGGSNVDFHHNWIHNLNDEGLVLDTYGRQDVRVHENVILKTLSPISFATGAVGGPFYIYRNLVDLRAPTAGYRPRFVGDTDVWRYGNPFKSNGVDGPYALFQNTFLVYAQVEQASYLHYRNLNGSYLRRSFNNIFVAVNPDADSDRPITLLPSPAFPAETDGNAYHRIGQATTPRYRYLEYQYDEPPPCSQRCSFDRNTSDCCSQGTFACLTGCTNALDESLLFEQSQSQYAPGYEADSIEANPQFQQIRADGLFRATDDLRLRSTSPARAAGVGLREPLLADLGAMDPFAPASGNPDIGCYPYGSGPLRVGVDGRRSYPASP